MLRLALSFSMACLAAAAQEPDLIVVGGGIAGLSAALEGARAGLKVTVVEQNSVPGGHAVISSGGLSLIGTPLQARMKIVDTPEIAERDFLTWGEDANAEFVRYYVRNSVTEIHDWMTALGTEFLFASKNGAGNSVARFHSPRGQGLGLVIPVYREILRQGGVTFLLNTRVTDLKMSDGRVNGVVIENLRTGTKSELKGKTVLLSTGGFAANLNLVLNSWPREMRRPERVLVGGGFFASGGGMDLAKQVGGVSGNLDHQWNYGSGLPDPFDPKGERGFFAMSFGAIWVNAQGKRFVLEQHEPKVTIPIIAAQQPARYWAIFDAEGRKGFRVVHAGYTQDRVEELFGVPNFIHSADSIAQLAARAGLPADALQASVDRYNGMVEAGEDSDFGRFRKDAPRPAGGFVMPPPRKIAQPPFYAAPMYILIRKSMGGIQVDLQSRVLNGDGKPIPGLLAAGEATGFGGLNGKHGMEGTFLGPSILMGRLAAKTVAAELQPVAAPAPTRELRLAPPVVKAKLASTCRGCHDMPKLVDAKRPGRWHFERAHELVLKRQWNCTGCHADVAPFKAATHKIDRELQSTTCQHCHISAPFTGRRVAASE
ncbi:MAG: FAD-dependent oxidoreductase [Bryobacteraceae bacterium]